MRPSSVGLAAPTPPENRSILPRHDNRLTCTTARRRRRRDDGRRLAQVAACAGIETTSIDVSAAILDASLERIRDSLQRLERRGSSTAVEVSRALNRIRTVTQVDAFGECEAIIEAAPEILEVEQELFVHLDALCSETVLLASNTSSLSVTEIASGTRNPERCIGMHFFNPPVLMQLVEVVPGVRSSSEAAQRGIALALQLGKTPVEARQRAGFIVNRVLRPFYLEALRILGEGIARRADYRSDHEDRRRVSNGAARAHRPGRSGREPGSESDRLRLLFQPPLDSVRTSSSSRWHIPDYTDARRAADSMRTRRASQLSLKRPRRFRWILPRPISIVGDGSLAIELRSAPASSAGLQISMTMWLTRR